MNLYFNYTFLNRTIFLYHLVVLNTVSYTGSYYIKDSTQKFGYFSVLLHNCVIYDGRLSTQRIQVRGEMPSVEVFLTDLHKLIQNSKKTVEIFGRLGRWRIWVQTQQFPRLPALLSADIFQTTAKFLN